MSAASSTYPDSTACASLQDVHKAFGKRPALIGVSLDIRERELLALVGSNGSGKTTMLHLLAGFTQADLGKVVVFGHSTLDRSWGRRKKVGFVSQDPALDPEMSVGETLSFFCALYGIGHEKKERIAKVSELMHIGDLFKREIAHLSGGQRQRVHLAVSLLQKPRLFLLDEPSNGLDPESQQQLWSILKVLQKEGHTVVISTHNLADAETYCDRLAILSQGKLLELGSPQDLRQRHESGLQGMYFELSKPASAPPGKRRGHRWM